MKVTIQSGIPAHDLSELIYQTIRAGMEADAAAARRRHEARMALIRKSGGSLPVAEGAEQGRLFE